MILLFGCDRIPGIGLPVQLLFFLFVFKAKILVLLLLFLVDKLLVFRNFLIQSSIRYRLSNIIRM